MKSLLFVLCMFLLKSCTTTHNHYSDPNTNRNNNYVNQEVINHHYYDRGDHIVVIINHRHRLTKSQRQKLRRWCHRHYGHHRKRIKCQFVLG